MVKCTEGCLFLNDIEIPNRKRNLIKTLGLERKELAYSDLLAELFDSTGGMETVTLILTELNLNEKFSLSVNTTFQVFREYHQIDILIVDDKGKFFVAIENKIDADEQDSQIARYQKTMQKYSEDFSGLFIFLTPSGRASKTKNLTSLYTCHDVSYNTISYCLEKLLVSYPDDTYIAELSMAIKENVILKKDENVNNTWGNYEHRQKLNYLVKNRPGIFSIVDELEKKISDYLAEKNDGIETCWHWGPQSQPVEELIIWTESINKLGYPIGFMFYDKVTQGNFPSFRVVIHKDSFKSMPKKKRQQLSECDPSFSLEPIKGWTAWISLYSGGSFSPQYVVKEDHDYGDKLVEIFFSVFVKEYEKLKSILNLI